MQARDPKQHASQISAISLFPPKCHAFPSQIGLSSPWLPSSTRFTLRTSAQTKWVTPALWISHSNTHEHFETIRQCNEKWRVDPQQSPEKLRQGSFHLTGRAAEKHDYALRTWCLRHSSQCQPGGVLNWTRSWVTTLHETNVGGLIFPEPKV